MASFGKDVNKAGINLDNIRTKAGKEFFNRLEMLVQWHLLNGGAPEEILRGILEIEREAMITCCNANVIHNIYPEGLKVSDHMMNPNIGGYLGTKEEK